MRIDKANVVPCGSIPFYNTSLTTYTGFEPICVHYCGEDLVGIVESATSILIRVRLDGYPQTAVLEHRASASPLWSYGRFMREQRGYLVINDKDLNLPHVIPSLQRDDNGQVMLSESGKNVAIALMKRLYELYHEPLKSQDQNCDALSVDTQMAVSRCFRDVRTPLVQEIPHIQKRCEDKYRAEFATLIKIRADLKKRFKLKELSEEAYKSARKELNLQIEALRKQERMAMRSEVEHYLQTSFGIMPNEAWRYAEGLSECK